MTLLSKKEGLSRTVTFGYHNQERDQKQLNGIAGKRDKVSIEKMNIRIAVLCDSATEYQYRLCIPGTFGTIRVTEEHTDSPPPNLNVQ